MLKAKSSGSSRNATLLSFLRLLLYKILAKSANVENIETWKQDCWKRQSCWKKSEGIICLWLVGSPNTSHQDHKPLRSLKARCTTATTNLLSFTWTAPVNASWALASAYPDIHLYCYSECLLVIAHWLPAENWPLPTDFALKHFHSLHVFFSCPQDFTWTAPVNASWALAYPHIHLHSSMIPWEHHSISSSLLLFPSG